MPCWHVGPHGPGCDGWVDPPPFTPTAPIIVPFAFDPHGGCAQREGELTAKVKALELQNERLQKDYSDVRNAHDATCRQAGKLETERDNLLRQIESLSKGILDNTTYPEPLINGSAVETAIALLKDRQEKIRLNREYLDHIEWAWGVIANAGPEGCMGNWSKLDPEWVKIAENWRDKYHKILDERNSPEKRE